ncbi:putative two-component system response regulator [Desulfomicrobium apsheronum]|uniref:Putative two-component system response regulator n=2 Tax=Desulfomicrobium apsheronum TaxID=52560 RepID=A0A1I3SKR3_9BACT|nr:putative two-component system response regulator [Desulfomicrobium apsheronum]
MMELSHCRVLAVDDTKLNLDILVNSLGADYELAVALDGVTALKMVQASPPDLILLDIMMPGMNGYEVLAKLKSRPETRAVPVIMISALSDLHTKSRGFQLGAVDYVSKPFEVEELRVRVRTHLSLAQAHKDLRRHNEILEEKVRERTRELILTQQATIESMAALAEYRDPETGQHIHRVKGYVTLLAEELRSLPEYAGLLSRDYIEILALSSPLHDIGKVGVPDQILLKPGPLSADEFREMQRHTDYGRNAILSVQKKLGSMPFLKIAEDIVYTHHEKWDGTGYPRGLAGTDIPLSGRIMALADVYDALISRRVYKAPFTHTRAMEIIIDGAGTHFDPDLVSVFGEFAPGFRQVALFNSESDEQRDALMC